MDKPIAIIITWSKEMLKRASFEEFEAMNTNGGYFLQKCDKKPKHDVLHCYIVADGKVRYRCNVSHWEAGGLHDIIGIDGRVYTISWPRLILTAQVVKAPWDIPYRGFQGFRYLENKLF